MRPLRTVDARRLSGLLLLATAGMLGAPTTGDAACGSQPWCDATLGAEARTQALLAALSLDEKIGLLAGDDPFGSLTGEPAVGTLDGLPRLNLPRVLFSDGPVGPRKGQATAHPAPLLLASSFDDALARRSGEVIANEVRLKGADLVHGPAVDILRTPLGGRGFESYGEDPYLSARMGVAWIQGAQSQGVIANVKHFVANNQEGQLGVPPLTGLIGSRLVVNAQVDARTLREIHLAPFEAAIKDGGAGSIMCAYNRVNGQPACSSPKLLTDILRQEWGFDGFVLSDYFFAMKNTMPALRAGTDLEMPVPVFYTRIALRSALLSGRIDAALIDQRLGNTLRTLFRFGFFDREPFPEREDLIDRAAHAAVAQQVAEAGIVMLQNDGLLPLDSTQLQWIAVIGESADRILSGGGSSAVQPFAVTTPLAGLRARAGSGIRIDHDDGRNLRRAAALAAQAEVALVFVAVEASEGVDRSCLAVSCPLSGDRQDALVQAVAAANPRTVVILQTGAPVLTPWRGSIAALVQAWFPGQEGGSALARIVFGDVDPGGRLAATFPDHPSQLPTAGDPLAYPGAVLQVRYREGVLVGYRHYDARGLEPAFPFGHGLSYTHFAYEDVQIDADDRVRVRVRNTGSRAGRTVAQLYLGLPSPAPRIVQPPWQLRGYAPVSLAPGQSTTLEFELPERAFAYWDVKSSDWRTAPGCYRVAVGESSRDLRLNDVIARGGAVCTP